MVPPILSASAIAVCIDCCSNVIAQVLKAYRSDVPFAFNAVLFTHFALFAALTAPLNFLWQGWLERTFPGWRKVQRGGPDVGMVDLEREGERAKERKSGEYSGAGIAANGQTDNGGGGKVRNWPNIAKKWFTDCITLGALFNTVAFLVIMGAFKSKSVGEIALDVRMETIPIIINSWKIWPIANFFSTTYVPVDRRIVFLSCCGLVWNIYLSLVAARL
ncbi:hypothetical protein K402DRAFT_366167 [Aulographum hederae CBS 113979]|uniref:Integral membrane protein-like protein n=1 Tax=Aulographum hederae CBS 113979 TaxID=1176131 RepID=A0A6G1HGE6_9PEZI|nr:hypothetical protein K402DRAFT_366167 [Aulographum hederae CBS 113979]